MSLRNPQVWPGLGLSVGVAILAFCLSKLEVGLAGRAWLGPIVLSILVGAAIRTLRPPAERFEHGISWAAKTLLELAVALLGANVSFAALSEIGAPLLAAIVTTVAVAIAGSFLIGRLLRLPGRMAMLIACGNAICGASAIAAVAPVVGADDEDVAAAIAFTAAMGVGVILALPLVAGLLRLSPTAAGVLAGLTVYAVPQVVAAAAPMGPAALQMGALVKLVRVLMLGPVVTGLSLMRIGKASPSATATRPPPRLGYFAPPFVLAFLALVALNSMGWIPRAVAVPIHQSGLALTVLAMAALGLGVDLRSLRAAGPRAVLAATGSLLLLCLIALAALWALDIA